MFLCTAIHPVPGLNIQLFIYIYLSIPVISEQVLNYRASHLVQWGWGPPLNQMQDTFSHLFQNTGRFEIKIMAFSKKILVGLASKKANPCSQLTRSPYHTSSCVPMIWNASTA